MQQAWQFPLWRRDLQDAEPLQQTQPKATEHVTSMAAPTLMTGRSQPRAPSSHTSVPSTKMNKPKNASHVTPLTAPTFVTSCRILKPTSAPSTHRMVVATSYATPQAAPTSVTRPSYNWTTLATTSTPSTQKLVVAISLVTFQAAPKLVTKHALYSTTSTSTSHPALKGW